MMTNFEMVKHLNEVMGNPEGEALTNHNRALVQLELIREEINELIKAIDAGDMIETRDAISDVLVTTYGLAHLLGIDADKDMKEVQESNMSKLCTNMVELSDTIDYYSQLGVTIGSRGELPEVCVYSVKDQSDYSGKFYPSGKFLKCINWKEPCFE